MYTHIYVSLNEQMKGMKNVTLFLSLMKKNVTTYKWIKSHTPNTKSHMLGAKRQTFQLAWRSRYYTYVYLLILYSRLIKYQLYCSSIYDKNDVLNYSNLQIGRFEFEFKLKFLHPY